VAVHGNEVGGPQKRNILLRQSQCLDVGVHFSLQLVLDGSQRKLRCVWEVRADRVDGSLGLTADATDVDVVLHAEALPADHHETRLALTDTWGKALVDHLTTSLHTTLEVLACALRHPRARLAGAPILAPLNELPNGVLLDVIVVRLLADKHFIHSCHAVTEIGAIVPALQVNDPNALAG